jgi:hypothetical protein
MAGAVGKRYIFNLPGSEDSYSARMEEVNFHPQPQIAKLYPCFCVPILFLLRRIIRSHMCLTNACRRGVTVWDTMALGSPCSRCLRF